MIFFKNESVTPTGSHKPNTAIPQAYYNKKEGVKKLATETGAGQWGSALAFAGAHFNLDINVFMVRASYEQKPYRKVMMQSYGAKVHASPSQETQIGKKMSEDKRNYPGSLGIAISEAVEVAATSGGTVKYSLGSVLNHVLMHQTVIGLEARAVLEDLGLYPGHRHCLPRRREQLRRHRHPLHGGQDLRARRRPSSSPPSRLPARRSARASTRTTSGTRESSSPWPRCTPSATASSRRRCTPAACATTAPRPSCRFSTTRG